MPINYIKQPIRKKNSGLLVKILIGFVLGILFGFIAGPFIETTPFLSDYIMPCIDLVGKIFMRLLMMLIVPLVFSSLVAGLGSVDDPRTLKRLGLKTLSLYLSTTLIALAIGMAAANFFRPGVLMSIPKNLSAVNIDKVMPVTDIILDVFPSNPISAMIDANMLQIIVFSFFIGVACLVTGETGRKFAKVCSKFAEIMYSVTRFVMSFAPYGVFALIAGTTVEFGIAILAPFAKLIAVVYSSAILHALIIYSLMILIFCRRSPMWFFKGIQETIITAFVTRSSSGTLPITLDNVRENFGVSDGISSFVLPLGATINMDGTVLYLGVCSIFIAQAFNILVTPEMLIAIAVSSTLASIGAAGVPGSGLIMLTTVLSSVGIPIEGVALVAGIDVILSGIRSCLNVVGDAAVCAVVAASEGEELKS